MATPGLLQPITSPNRIWEEISMDFIDALPMSHGFTTIWVVVDRLSKYAHFIPVKHPYTAASIAQLFMSHIYKLHGLPKSILSDRDPVFLSHFWTELFKRCKVQLNLTSAYHPQSDGQTERVNRCIETYLRCMTGSKPQEWTDWIHLAEWWYNISFHSAIQSTPYEIVYGQPPPPYIPYIPGDSRNTAVDRSLNARERVLKHLKEQLMMAQNRMKQQADKHRSERTFQVGAWVFLKLHPFRQFTLLQQHTHKLSPKYCGPFQILERIGPVAYRLALPVTAKVHNVVHVCLLKKCWSGAEEDSTVISELPDCLLRSTESALFPARVLDRKFVKNRNTARTIWLIQWQGQYAEDATWECARDMLLRFPEFSFNS